VCVAISKHLVIVSV